MTDNIEVFDLRKFTNKYTTLELISADKTGEETKKIPISLDTYAHCEMLQEIFIKLEHLRVALTK